MLIRPPNLPTGGQYLREIILFKYDSDPNDDRWGYAITYYRKEEAFHKTPSEIIGEMVREKIAVNL
jgi:hypothetical protein